MDNEDVVKDPLKPIDLICEPDARQKNFIGTLEDRHSELESLILNEATPIDVRQLFETAKNLSLYSWYVYRFHQVAELIGFSALEMALRIRYLDKNLVDSSSKQRSLTLYPLLQHAKKERWITNDGFPSFYQRAKYSTQLEKAIDKMQTDDFQNEPTAQIEEPSSDEILDALANLDMVGEIANNAHKIRNDIAHGSDTLHPHSISTLRTISEVINQIYP